MEYPVTQSPKSTNHVIRARGRRGSVYQLLRLAEPRRRLRNVA
jgi:hypothetical protein